MQNKQLKKYLRSRTIASPWEIEGTDRQDYKAAVVVPALAERNSLSKTLASLATNPGEYLQQTLILIVVNNRADSSAEQLQDNQQTLLWLKSSPVAELNVAWIDASSPSLELPAKEGVGLARKIGFDHALSQLAWSQQPLLVSLDADTLVDEHYLPAIFTHFENSQCGGASLPFRHQEAEEPQQESAIRHYELYLRSYLFGLQQAGSPYAYHTIGSAFACRADAYIAAGGMNRRLAAEDFYFLQQLAKTSGVEILRGTVVRPSPRYSSRVPFGTGMAVQGQVESDLRLFQFSSAAGFSLLRQWLDLVTESLEQPGGYIFEQAAELSPVLELFLAELNFVAVWTRLRANHFDFPSRQRAFHGWFDGLRSRQLLSRLDAGRQQQGAGLVAELLAWGGYPEVTAEAEQLLLLEQLQYVKNH